ncbi:polyprenyl glycosylphosphotransferase [Microbacterium sp. Root61]|uniref:sugar transferase n=1 Tax=Microbacterium sp. Root61 TaxID=1736570 RepID=UPI0006FF41F8|nr:sugar transferase [Microbacterium sp. Root61]KRA24982.1 polyprenyl glycosylphosphotransferase [Microbacterium sp. Root61]
MTASTSPIGTIGVRAIRPFGTASVPEAATPHLSASTAPRPEAALARRKRWEHQYARRLLWSDIAIIGVTTIGAEMVDLAARPVESAPMDLWSLMRVAATVVTSWLVMLALFHTRSAGIIGSGATEYKRVAHASGFAFGILAILFIAVQWQGIRMELIVALPLGLLALLATRWSARRWLTSQRRAGLYSARTIVAGMQDDVEYVIRSLEKHGNLGYLIVGAATVGDLTTELIVDGRRYPIVGTPDDVAAVARQLEADSIVVASRPDGDPDYVKRLSWQLEGCAAELVLSSRLTDVAGPRISLRPIDGLPLIAVRIPEFEGGQHALKRAMDVLVALVALIPISLATIVIATLIALDDGGPVFFRQTRIGRHGREFAILKFRTMRTTAESELADLRYANEGAGPLFKLRHDPRVTRIGAVLRKFSLDELPQFWNVLRGEMSVVGPRPPLPEEVSAYNGTLCRRLFIKPGITGLWQVSGRSDLSWDESVRLDLRYVENWSVMTDLMIMWRTAQVMLHPKGAY